MDGTIERTDSHCPECSEDILFLTRRAARLGTNLPVVVGVVGEASGKTCHLVYIAKALRADLDTKAVK